MQRTNSSPGSLGMHASSKFHPHRTNLFPHHLDSILHHPAPISMAQSCRPLTTRLVLTTFRNRPLALDLGCCQVTVISRLGLRGLIWILYHWHPLIYHPLLPNWPLPNRLLSYDHPFSYLCLPSLSSRVRVSPTARTHHLSPTAPRLPPLDNNNNNNNNPRPQSECHYPPWLRPTLPVGLNPINISNARWGAAQTPTTAKKAYATTSAQCTGSAATLAASPSASAPRGVGSGTTHPRTASDRNPISAAAGPPTTGATITCGTYAGASRRAGAYTFAPTACRDTIPLRRENISSMWRGVKGGQGDRGATEDNQTRHGTRLGYDWSVG
ncbi:hypothetical protein QBC33DRAFT_317185 [Phialemonium atrogriseum]|uniref:Uncharacterized protein n=1 Tax=Phialemonium atrogriseum TaxID=1093897 RepID=A0AAJ0BP20_9PEZI|nr:uncharacterized protein QBC33DRAFT_317185 [Phialemonium atrogriseum]KAK1761844.1 hypothetical protein QBC33DRAFT_317185 [Phialemonium atrogriseum]